MAKNILLTGATGFIGSQVLNRLIEKKHQVVVVLRPTSDIWRIAHLKGDFIPWTIDASMEFDDALRLNSIDTIIHTATEYGRAAHLSSVLLGNVIFPVKLIEAGLRNGLKKFINTDTFICKYPYTGTYLKDYADSKTMLRGFLKSFSSQILVDNLRLEHPYGEHDAEGKFVPMIINSLLENKDTLQLTSGEQKRDFVYVADVVEAFMAVLENDNENVNGFSEFEVGTGSSIRVREFVERVASLIGSHTRLHFGALHNREGEPQDSRADTAKLAALGWAPRYDLETAIARIISAEKKAGRN